MARVRIERNISFDEERKRYYVNLDFGLNPDTGKQIKRTRTFKKLTEARSTLRRHEADRDRGNIVLPQELTVAQWLDRWMKEVVEFSCESTTVYSYRKIIEKHIVPALGSIPLQKLTPQHLQHYYAEKINGGLSSNTVRKHHDLLNTALKVAVRQEILLYSPSEKVEAPKIKRPDIHYYSMEQIQTLFHLAEGTRLEVLIKLAGYLGLRREEIMGLTWEHVDLEARKIEISSVRTSAGNQIINKRPKNETSRRVLYIPEDLVLALQQEQECQSAYKSKLGDGYIDSGYVFTHEDGRPVRPNYASDLFTKFIQDNGLPPLTLHGLRHSFASIANANGIPMYDIGKALGHSSPATTSKIYTHLLDPDHQGMLSQIWDKGA